MEKNKVYLEVYSLEVERDIKRFREYWEKMGKNDPVNFPIKLDLGQWDEQFRAFIDTEE